MAGVNQVIEKNKVQRAAYMKRLAAAVKAIDKMGRGTRTTIARDTLISAATISAILGGRRISLGTLTLIEAWVDKRKAADLAKAAVKRASVKRATPEELEARRNARQVSLGIRAADPSIVLRVSRKRVRAADETVRTA